MCISCGKALSLVLMTRSVMNVKVKYQGHIFVFVLLKKLLAAPDLKKPVNPEAAEMIMRSPHSYRQMVLDCVAASQRVEGSYKDIDPAKYSE